MSAAIERAAVMGSDQGLGACMAMMVAAAGNAVHGRAFIGGINRRLQVLEH